MEKMPKSWLAGAAAALFFFTSALITFASNVTINLTNPLSGMSGGSTVNGIVANIGAFMLALAMPICGIMVLVGAFQMMTSAGDPAKFSNGKKTLIYAAVGFVVVLLASSVVPIIKSIL